MILLALFALVDVALCLVAFDGGLPATPWFGALHTILTLGALITSRRTPLLRDGWNGLALSLGAAAGPCGILALAIMQPWLLPATKLRSVRPPFRPDLAADAPEPPIVARLMDQRLRFPDDQHVESLAVILRHGDLASRCKALETAVRSFEPRLSPLIATALSDADQTVRALAAATAAQVSANVVERLARLEAKPRTDIVEQYDFAMIMFENGVHNELLSQSQRVQLCGKARTALLELLRKSHELGDRGVAVSAALVRLGIDLVRSGPGNACGASGTGRSAEAARLTA